MSRQRTIVSYDIACPRRLRNVAKIVGGYGYRLQYSVFECLMDDINREKLKAELAETIHHTEDQVLLIALHTREEDGSLAIESIGLPYRAHSRVTII